MLGKLALLIAVLVAPTLYVAAPADGATGDISGTVTAYGLARVGIPVRAYSLVSDSGKQSPAGETVTDASGHYTLQPSLSRVVVCFESTEYVQQCWNGLAQDQGDGNRYGNAVDVQTPGGVSGIDASLVRGGQISGSLGVDNIRPLVGGQVNATSEGAFFHTTTDAAGNYAFAHVPPGTYKVCAWGPNLLQLCTQEQVVGDDGVFGNADLYFDSRPTNFAATQGGRDWMRWSWNPLAGATRFRIAISTSPTMSNAKIRYVDGRFATYRGLTPGKKYYAAVRGQNLTQTTAATAVFPARPGTVSGLRLWNASQSDLVIRSATYEKAPRYEYQLSSTPTFAGFRSRGTSEPLVQFFNLRASTTYYARVRATDSQGKPLTGWSGTVAMKTWH